MKIRADELEIGQTIVERDGLAEIVEIITNVCGCIDKVIVTAKGYPIGFKRYDVVEIIAI